MGGLFHGGQACHLTQSNPMGNQNGVAAPERKKSIFIDFTDSYDSNADDFDSQLSDYGVQPLTSNTAPGKNKKQKIIRMKWQKSLTNQASNALIWPLTAEKAAEKAESEKRVAKEKKM